MSGFIVMGGEGSTWELPGAPIGARLEIDVRDPIVLVGDGFPANLRPGMYVAERLATGWRVMGVGVE